MNAARRWCAHCTHGGPFLRTAAAAAAEGAVAAASAAVLAAAIRRQQSWQQASRHGRRSGTAGGTADAGDGSAAGAVLVPTARSRVVRATRQRRQARCVCSCVSVWSSSQMAMGCYATGACSRRAAHSPDRTAALTLVTCVSLSQAAHSAAEKITYSAPRVLVTRLVQRTHREHVIVTVPVMSNVILALSRALTMVNQR